MANSRVKPGETPEQARLRYNAEMAAYRKLRKEQGRPLREDYDYAKDSNRAMLRRYGIGHTEATAMLAEQGGCSICKKPLSIDNRGKPTEEHSAVDHCHATGRVRGILCMHCNQGLGKFFDKPELLLAAAAYLNK